MYRVNRVTLPDPVVTSLNGYVAARPSGVRTLVGRLSALLSPHSTRALADRAEAATKVLAVGNAFAVTLDHDRAPIVSHHEHGLLAFAAIDAQRPLMLDISSIADDPRWDLAERQALWQQTWSWLRWPEHDAAISLSTDFTFEARGEPVPPIDIGWFHGTELECHLTDDWPGDDAELLLSLDQITTLARPAGSA